VLNGTRFFQRKKSALIRSKVATASVPAEISRSEVTRHLRGVVAAIGLLAARGARRRRAAHHFTRMPLCRALVHGGRSVAWQRLLAYFPWMPFKHNASCRHRRWCMDPNWIAGVIGRVVSSQTDSHWLRYPDHLVEGRDSYGGFSLLAA